MSGLTSGVTAIATGANHTCALTGVGASQCWGGNDSGQLGDNSTTQRNVPTDVFGLVSGITAIAAGNHHTCALTSVGSVKCWGYNDNGQLGDNSTTQHNMPTDVTELASGVMAISAGRNQTCALTTTGAVKCWGANGSGQLGDNISTQHLMPIDVSGLASGVTAIAAGAYHTCALTAAGAVKCWGRNSLGQLGDNSVTQRNVPTDVSGLASGITAIASVSSHTCALTNAGALKCWGYNGNGQLGDGGTTNRHIPTNVSGLTAGVTAIAAGGIHTCALTGAGAVKCWGFNFFGQLGDNSTSQRNVPTDVSGLTSGVTAIAAGDYHTCALTSTGGVKCWGYNGNGQLGNNSTTQRLIPTDVSGLTAGVTAIVAGANHTCALTSVGAVRCWGENDSGQLGDGSTTQRNEPTDVSGLAAGVTAIAAGISHTCALTSAGGFKCWGYNANGQLGDNGTAQRNVPTDVSGLTSDVLHVAPASSHTCAVTLSGRAKCWGNNFNGQLGSSSVPTGLDILDVFGLSGIHRVEMIFGM